MAFAKITGAGLVSIAVLVACLWGCLLTEHRIMKDSLRRQTLELIQLRQLREGRRLMPASLPMGPNRSLRPIAG